MDFTAVAFYPVIVFSLILFLIQRKWVLYYVFLFLGFLVKEDGPFYFACLGGFLLVFMKNYRMVGLITLGLSFGYEIFIIKVLMPVTGNTIAGGIARNYPQYLGPNETPGEVVRYLLTHPQAILKEFFLPLEKVDTLFKVFSKVLFLPLLSPWSLVVFGVIFPCFMQGGIDENFMQLKFHYSAPTISFLFVALVFGISNLLGWIAAKEWKKWVVLALSLGLIAMNGGNYYRARFTSDDIKTIQLAKSLDPSKSLTTHGHLFPYIGYRENALYFTYQLEKGEAHPFKDWYRNSDYVLIDLEVNPYPFTRDEVRQKFEKLKKRKDLVLTYQDGRRFLFERKTS